MSATVHRLLQADQDHPIPLLHRRLVKGDRMLLAHVILDKGCVVPTHSHESEQIACVISGRVRWCLGEPGSQGYREVEVGESEVVVLPSNFPHGVTALEDTVIVDILSPPGPMGVDALVRD